MRPSSTAAAGVPTLMFRVHFTDLKPASQRTTKRKTTSPSCQINRSKTLYFSLTGLNRVFRDSCLSRLFEFGPGYIKASNKYMKGKNTTGSPRAFCAPLSPSTPQVEMLNRCSNTPLPNTSKSLDQFQTIAKKHVINWVVGSKEHLPAVVRFKDWRLQASKDLASRWVSLTLRFCVEAARMKRPKAYRSALGSTAFITR